MANGSTGEIRKHTINRRKVVRITCPSCGHRVGDASAHSRMLIQLAENETAEPADIYIKCGRCKAEIAVQKTE